MITILQNGFTEEEICLDGVAGIDVINDQIEIANSHTNGVSVTSCFSLYSIGYTSAYT